MRIPNRFGNLLGLLLIASFGISAARQAEGAAVFPLQASASGRWLEDQQGKPMLITGDTAWSLIVQLEETDLETYLQNRQQLEFNSIIVNLLEHKFCTTPPKTRRLVAPFTVAGDFGTPNPEYFSYARRVVQAANTHGIAVWLAPAYLGFNGGDEGFFQEIKASGREKLRAYGRFVGRQFKDFPNVVWMVGGDYTPPKEDRWTVTELAEGIREEDQGHCMTVHGAPERSAAATFGQEPWLTVNTVYSYEQTLFRPLLAERQIRPVRPFVLIESTYEGEHDAQPGQIRRQAYWALLSGAAGQFFGNNPIWHFDGPGIFKVQTTWQESLQSAGALDMSRLHHLMAGLPWHRLQPEENHSIVAEGFGSGTNTVLSAQTDDGRLIIAYIPSSGGKESRELVLNGAALTGPMHVQWFNPSTGMLSPAAGGPLAAGRRQRIRTPGDNGGQANDWVLLLRAPE